MFTRRDAENVFDRVSEHGVDWEFWEENGDFNDWVSSDGEWLVQVSHRHDVVVLSHNDPDSDEQVLVVTPYDDERLGVKLLVAMTANPHRTHDRLRDNPATKVVSTSIAVE